VTDREIAEQLAEIGVILLMFGVGLHFFHGRSDGRASHRSSGSDRADHYRNGGRDKHGSAVGVLLSSVGSKIECAKRSQRSTETELLTVIAKVNDRQTVSRRVLDQFKGDQRFPTSV
jgi:hypothetical protein